MNYDELVTAIDSFIIDDLDIVQTEQLTQTIDKLRDELNLHLIDLREEEPLTQYHNWKVNDTIKALRDAEYSWGLKVKKGDGVILLCEEDLERLDFSGVTNWFEKA